jgi:hypothetical protein
VVRVTDRVNLLAVNRIENGGIKVTIQDLEDPSAVSFEVSGRKPGFVLMECENPITSTYVLSLPVPEGTRKGANRLRIKLAGRELAAVEIAIA